MKTKVFIDTNIVVDFLFKREPFAEAAARLIDLCEQDKIIGYLPAPTFPFLFYLLAKNQRSKAKAWEIVTTLKQLFTVLPLEESTLDLALGSAFSDLEDAIQYQLAVQYGANFFVTRNKQDFKKSKIPVLDAGEFLRRVVIDRRTTD